MKKYAFASLCFTFLSFSSANAYDFYIPETLFTPSPTYSFTKQDKVCLARNIYFESKGERLNRMLAVGEATLNRLESGKTICQIVNEKRTVNGKVSCQFQWVCTKPRVREKDLYAQAEQIAQALTAGYNPEIVFDAKFFMKCGFRAPWMRDMSKIRRVGNHCFYDEFGTEIKLSTPHTLNLLKAESLFYHNNSVHLVFGSGVDTSIKRIPLT